MERWVAKVIALLAVFILPLVSTLLPYKVSNFFQKKGEKGKKILSCLMCFGGGVFFATFILHMAPESRMILDRALLDPNHITYPVADLIMGAGFFLVFFLEKICLKVHKKRHQKKMALKNLQCLQKKDSVIAVECECCDCKPPKNKSLCDCEGHCGGLSDMPKVQISNGGDCETSKLNGTLSGMTNDCPLLGSGECCADSESVKIKMKEGQAFALHMQPNGEVVLQDDETLHSHSTRSLVLVVALSLHRIFEGMSIGLQHSTSDVWNLLIAVMCHEIVIGFGLGLQFVKNQFRFTRMVLACFLCSCIMPVGVAIGTVLVEVSNGEQGFDMVNGILQSIATGTFIYVTFFEILQEEIDPHDTSMSKFFSVFLGFALMAVLCAIPEEQSVNLKHEAFMGHSHNISVILTTLADEAMVTVAG